MKHNKVSNDAYNTVPSSEAEAYEYDSSPLMPLQDSPVKLPQHITRSRLYMKLKRRIEERLHTTSGNKKSKGEIKVSKGTLISQESSQHEGNNMYQIDESDDINMDNAFGPEKKNVGALLMAAVAMSELRTDTNASDNECDINMHTGETGMSENIISGDALVTPE